MPNWGEEPTDKEQSHKDRSVGHITRITYLHTTLWYPTYLQAAGSHVKALQTRR